MEEKKAILTVALDEETFERIAPLLKRRSLSVRTVSQGSEAEALAKRHIELAISIAPNSATGYYFLGQLHKACDREQQAMKMFRKVLDLLPDHVEAAREVRLMGMRKAKDDKAGGLFGFGKKRK